MTSSLSKSDLALFPGVAAVQHTNPTDLLEAAGRNPYLPSQLNHSQLTLLVEHIKQLRRMCLKTVLVYLRCLHQLKQWEEMVSVGTEFLRRNPSASSVRQLRVQAYFECQDWNGYIKDCDAVMDEYNPDLLLLKQRCYAYFKIGAISGMLHDVRKIVGLSAREPEYRIERDLDPANTAACLRALVMLAHYFPHDTELHRSLAYSLFHYQRWEALIHICTTWQLTIAPRTDPEIVRLKLHAYVSLKAWDFVIHETTKILHQSPGDTAMLALRAKAYACHGNLLMSLRDNLAQSAKNVISAGKC